MRNKVSHLFIQDQLIQCSTTEARDRLLPKLMSGEMDVILENYPAV